ncbi:uridine kinase [Haloactinomyces albus]|uniref:Uridine kinase n=1 Tax=Haloactinomyces albus TaxID=1352928 RepID=A0AAE3ZEH1_9ACTN|nr:uridine kinase [Haloactinomyces albus]MDR7303422.1 hypothetical protein [Haloactinomyces albus]
MQVRPLTPQALVSELLDRVDTHAADPWTRIAIDGAPEAATAELADALVDPLRVRGREVIRVRTCDYLRPASLRLEYGHHDPDSYYLDWFDFNGLRREVLDPLAAGGSGHVLPALRDPDTGRSPRLERVPLPQRGVVIVDGPLLLGGELPFELTVHLWLPPAALQRRASDSQRWRLPAFDRYTAEVRPERVADYVVRVDRPGHPAAIDAW